ncbi:hypothetical protein STRDD10_00691 [Streptococcus sp. DD10]|nr:hypothetical protein STRDD10_00691 [Streptococcus sp. DD10]
MLRNMGTINQVETSNMTKEELLDQLVAETVGARHCPS